MARNTLSRTLHDLGLSAWFGGTLANAGWDRWTPVNAAAIGAHLIGSVGQLRANKQRVAAQRGVAGMSTLKTLLTAAALGATAYSRVLGQRVSAAENPPSKRGTKPSKRTKALAPDVAAAQEQLDTLQWVIPALTGALVAISSYAGEQQRPSEVAKGIDAG